jgi:hypothetical protein
VIRPATFLKLTPFYIYIFFLLLLTSLVLKLYLLLSAVHLFLIALNTRKLADPIVLFILMGSFSYFVAGFYSANGNTLFLKHLITVGYFMPVITASYYVFVPML